MSRIHYATQGIEPAYSNQYARVIRPYFDISKLEVYENGPGAQLRREIKRLLESNRTLATKAIAADKVEV